MKTYLIVLIMLALAGCSKLGKDELMAPAARLVAVKEMSAEQSAAAPANRRYLALKHFVTLSVPAASLSQQFNAIQAECIKLGCEILRAGLSAKMHGADASASLSARVPPAAFSAFFTGIQAHGHLLSQRSESEDKTAQVIDVEARIKNLDALKARVLQLLASKAGNLQDLLAAEKQLAETQAALDSIHEQRRVLASETDMVRIDIELVTESLGTQGSLAAPVVDAFTESGTVLMNSVGMLITFVIAVLPWTLLGALLLWPVRRAWRRRKAAKALRET